MSVMQTSDGVRFLRTPDVHFETLPDYPFSPHYLEFEGLRLHYVDEGPRDAPIALLLHGMPTWSFLNRHIIAGLLGAGYRCVAADHIGFGRSDKPIDDAWYSIEKHARAHARLIEALDLNRVSLFVQDWGGPIGLAQAAATPQRFDRLVIMNTWIHHEGYEYTDALRSWNRNWQEGGLFAQHVPDPVSIGRFMMMATGQVEPPSFMALVREGKPFDLTPAQAQVQRGYDAPFAGLGRDGHAGPRRFPLSLPFYNPEGGAAALQQQWWEKLNSWDKPAHFIWGGRDDVFTEAWGRKWSGMYAQASFDLLPDARHFLQETHGREIARLFLERAGRA